MYELHRKMDVLVMTSAFEGFPLVIMEAMANGVVPLCTAVDAIPEHIIDGETGMLMFNPSDEKGVIHSGVQKISQICENPDQLHYISSKTAKYALQHFSRERFIASYRNLVLTPNEKQSH
jgi:glycosyltransferase involved in cell wall biosynthesis